MRWAVIYSSVTGNTAKIAVAIAEKLRENDDCDMFPLADAPADLAAYDAIALGFWLWRGGPDEKMRQYMAQISEKYVLLFATHAAEKSSEHAITALARAAAALGRGCTVLATFECQGELAPHLVERRQNLPAADPHKNNGGWLTAFGHPDAADLSAAAAIAAKAARKLEYFRNKTSGKQPVSVRKLHEL